MSPYNTPPGLGVMYCAECGRPAAPEDLARFGDLMICPDCKNAYAQKLREGVAPARVTVEYAGFWIRLVAAIIDGIILAVVGSILQFGLMGSLVKTPLPTMGASPEEALGSIMGLLGILWLMNTAIGCAYEAFFVNKLMATPGKMALGLKVVRPDGTRVSLGRAAGRYFAKMLSAIILGIGYIMAGFDSEKRALHDMICDTRVIRTQN